MTAMAVAMLTSAASAQTGTGTIEGQVFNATTGFVLRNVQAKLEGRPGTFVTDDNGYFFFEAVPAGPVRIAVSYLGFGVQSTTVTVVAGKTAQVDFELKPLSDDGVVELEAFTVVADREVSAQAEALNERRNASNIKNVVAYDEYGDRSAENIGEFLRFLPGVAVDAAGDFPDSVSLRGLPASLTVFQVDGADVANARNNSRQPSLRDIPTGNISRVEVTKVPTPDMPASGLGGSINIIKKSGFETKKPVFDYQLYYLYKTDHSLLPDVTGKGQNDSLRPRQYRPSGEFSYLHPFNSNFAITVSGARTWRLREMDGDVDTQADWNFADGYQRLSTWQSLQQIVQTDSAQIGADWRLSPRDVISVNYKFREVSNYIMRMDFLADFGNSKTDATGDQTYSQSEAGEGEVTQGEGSNQEATEEINHTTLKYQHRGEKWNIDFAGAYSHADAQVSDISNGHFNGINATINNLALRGDGIGETDSPIPTRFSATRSGASIDLFDGGNYSIGNLTSRESAATNAKYMGRFDVTRSFDTANPFSLKAGVYFDRMEFDTQKFNRTWSFRPNGSGSISARSASNFDVFDDEFNEVAPKIFGETMRWISIPKVYALYEENPDWFVLNESNYIRDLARNSTKLIESITASYLRADARLFDERLWLVGGVRFEKTEDEGWGVLEDSTAAVEYVERGNHVTRDYDGVYPSFNATYNLTEKLVIRAAYANTIGRPDIDNLVPGARISGSGPIDGIVTINNPGLEPWTAHNFDLSLETYQIKGGFGSVGLFYKEISNFFDTITIPDATLEQLESYGLSDTYVGYDLETSVNTDVSTSVTGVELGYSQSLFFLPHWARGLQVYFNYTHLELDGSRQGDFSEFSPSEYAIGINLVRPRFYIKFNVAGKAETRGGYISPNANQGIGDDYFNYQNERLSYGLNAQYSFKKWLAVYGSISNIGGLVGGNNRYAPDTPEYMKTRRRIEQASTITLGLKGRF